MIINSYKYAYDPDAQAFFTAAGITDNTQKRAVNTLVIALKNNNLWTLFIAIYPLVGGSATTHKFNLKDPRDLDAAFRLVFSGGITHNSNGITGNGTNNIAATKIIPSSHLLLNDSSGFVYSRSNISGSYGDFGVIKSLAPQDRFQMNTRNASNLFNTACNDTTLSGNANLDSRGFFGISRISSSGYSQSFNNTQTNVSVTSTTLNSNELYFTCVNSGGSAAVFSSRNYAFACFGKGLTDTNCDTLYTIVQEYQTTLSRNV